MMFFGMRGTNNTIRLLAAMVPSLAGQTLTRVGESLVKHVLDTR